MLHRNQEQRAKEFEQAQELSSRLMAVMGLKQPEAASDNFQSDKALQDLGSPGACSPDSTAAVTKSFGSSASSTSRPTPKRPKTYQRFKSSASHRTKIVFNTTNGKAIRESTIKGGRPLTKLSDVTKNAGRSSQSQPLRQKRDRIQEIDETSKENGEVDCGDDPDHEPFDDSDMFTVISQHSLSGQWNKATSVALDDTTVEF